MNYWTLLLIAHLLVSTYAFFMAWKDDMIFKGISIDQFVAGGKGPSSHQKAFMFVCFICLCPVVNLITLYNLVTSDFADLHFYYGLFKSDYA